MGRPVARRIDPCLCATHSAPTRPAISSPTNVNINGQPAALQKDGRFCKGALPDTLIAGASTVRINSRLVVPSMLSVSLHGALFVSGSANVMVGGPLMVGDAAYWKDICQKMCTTREPNHLKLKELQAAPRDKRAALKSPVPRTYRAGQSTRMNCGCETARQVIWGYGLAEPTEEDVLLDALDKQRAQSHPKGRGTPVEDWELAGGTKAPDRMGIIDDWGKSAAPPMRTIERDDAAVVEALKSGRQVILPINNGGNHVILVTGVELDDSGNVVAIYVNDTDPNTGGCGKRIPWDQRPRLDTSDYPVVVGG